MNWFIRSLVCAVAVFDVSYLAAQQPLNPSQPLVSDAALEPGGILRGRVLDKDGSPLAGIPVVAGQDRPPTPTLLQAPNQTGKNERRRHDGKKGNGRR